MKEREREKKTKNLSNINIYISMDDLNTPRGRYNFY